MTNQIVEPSHADSIAADASGSIGGPIGSFRSKNNWWNPIRVLIALSASVYAIGYVLDLSCRNSGWVSPENYEHLCYSDIPPLFSLRGFADGLLPYLQTMPGQTPLEYPVITGIFMQVAAMITRVITAIVPSMPASTVFFDVNVVLLFIPLVVAVVATALTVRRRPWDAAMFALAPGVLLAATINWDLLPLAFAGIALLLWSRNRPFAAGLLLGLAVAAKFYPLLFLGAFLVLTMRSGKWRPFAALVGGTVLTWLMVNVPFIVGNFDGWAFFYTFSQSRGQDFGSFWFALSQLELPNVSNEILNMVATGCFLVMCLAIAILALRAKRRPRLAQLLFLIIAAFAVTNKVYSPQYVLWLIPLAVLARPKWRDFIIWQVGEVIYFVAVWWFLVGYGNADVKGLTQQWYALAILVHIAATSYFAIMVIRDIVQPEHDPVRSDGFTEDADDPGGGPYDKSADVFTLRRA
jgi:uncharacterized membrane protein